MRNPVTSFSVVGFDEGGQKISIHGGSEFKFSIKQTGACSGPGQTEAR